MRSISVRFSGSLLLLAAALAGCGEKETREKTYPVTGTVKFSDGSPLTRGTVNFEGERLASKGDLKPDGTFTLRTYEATADGAPAGTYKVYVTGTNEPGQGDSYAKPGPNLVDPKFNSAETSGIKREVKAGENKIDDIVVEKPKK